jgi:hypothetical protein
MSTEKTKGALDTDRPRRRGLGRNVWERLPSSMLLAVLWLVALLAALFLVLDLPRGLH